MNRFKSNTGLALCLSYLGLYLLSGVYTVVFLLFHRPPGEFNPPGIAALPWSLVLIPIYHQMGILTLYDRLIKSPVLYGGLMMLVLLPAALLNALILYAFGRLLDRLRRAP
jgi:hypothetical protein